MVVPTCYFGFVILRLLILQFGHTNCLAVGNLIMEIPDSLHIPYNLQDAFPSFCCTFIVLASSLVMWCNLQP